MMSLVCVLAQEGVQQNWMDVTWVLQGRDIQFQGFFVEFLGFAKQFMTKFPLASLEKSSFYTSMREDPFQNRRKFLSEDLFEHERHVMDRLLDPGVPSGLIMGPSSKHLREALNSVESQCGDSSRWNRDDVNALELSKYVARSVSSSQECCNSCYAHPGCLSWTFSSESLMCNLHRQTRNIQSKASPTVSDELDSDGMNKIHGEINGRAPKPRAIILHGTTCLYRNSSIVQYRDIHTVVIGRYMLERADFSGGLTLDEYAVSYCMNLVDELWVPSEWHRDVFIRLIQRYSGRGHLPPIVIVPEAVDTELLDPRSSPLVTEVSDSSSSEIPSESGITLDRSVYYIKDPQEHGHCFYAVAGRSSSGSNEAEIELSSPEGVTSEATSMLPYVHCVQGKPYFEFLSVFKWERRKGWDLLLTAYWTAFTPKDAVLLRIRSYIPASDHNQQSIEERIRHFARERFGVDDLNELAAVVIEDGRNKCLYESNGRMTPKYSFHRPQVTSSTATAGSDLKSDTYSRLDMRAMYSAADAFVLPTRGEGWGLPIAEAMAMALPVIVSDSPGPRAYIDANNAYIVEVEETLDSLSFVRPKVESLVDRLRQVVFDSTAEGKYAAQKKGGQARRQMQNITGDSIVDIMSLRLQYHASLRGWEY